MVHLNIVNPAPQLHFLSRLIRRGSSRILRRRNAISTHEEDTSSRVAKITVSDLINRDLPPIPQEYLTRDPEFYKEDLQGGLCVFRAENTLFKVHKCYLLRESSAFGDMFSLPNVPESVEGLSDDAPIPLSDTAEEFQDLLWVLYALPSQLACATESDSPSLERLLNIAKLTNKYCIASYETWALERILALAQIPNGFLRTVSPEICARALDVAVLSNHALLLEVIMHRLVARMLWSDVDRQAILSVAENRGLRKLQGVAYYRELVDLDRQSAGATSRCDHLYNRISFPLEMTVEKRMRLVAAHDSLVNLWDCLSASPPTFNEHGCPSHERCLDSWAEMWLAAATASQTQRCTTVDVLGRLKAMMILLKKSMKQESSQVTMRCTLAALESITTTRDDIIIGLMDHFQGS